MGATDDPLLDTNGSVAYNYLDRFGYDVDKEERWFGPLCKNLREAIR
jgi:hypothetical protein